MCQCCFKSEGDCLVSVPDPWWSVPQCVHSVRGPLVLHVCLCQHHGGHLPGGTQGVWTVFEWILRYRCHPIHLPLRCLWCACVCVCVCVWVGVHVDVCACMLLRARMCVCVWERERERERDLNPWLLWWWQWNIMFRFSPTPISLNRFLHTLMSINPQPRTSPL